MYQQGTQRIEIIVRKEDTAVATAGANETTEDEQVSEKTWRSALFGTENKIKIKNTVRNASLHALAISKQALNTVIRYYISNLGDANGDQAYQQTVERQVEQFQDVSNFFIGAGLGAVAGMKGGPVGIVVGAVLGATSSAINTVSKYANRDREYKWKVFHEENGIEYKRARANISLTTGRLR